MKKPTKRQRLGIADMGEVLRDCRAAADRIKELEAEAKGLRDLLVDWKEECFFQKQRAGRAEGRLEAVRVEAREEAAKVADEAERLQACDHGDANTGGAQQAADMIPALAPAKTGGA